MCSSSSRAPGAKSRLCLLKNRTNLRRRPPVTASHNAEHRGTSGFHLQEPIRARKVVSQTARILQIANALTVAAAASAVMPAAVLIASPEKASSDASLFFTDEREAPVESAGRDFPQDRPVNPPLARARRARPRHTRRRGDLRRNRSLLRFS
jgi:hypothetical protein